jgi:S-adenosylmethionine decarboxylase proenzyme
MEGLHILANFYHCQFDFIQEDILLNKAIEYCQESGLQVVGYSKHHFQPQGLTFALLLAESHLSIHTWPENGNIAFDIYTCNYQSDNSHKTREVYEKMKKLLQPSHVDYKEISREKLD